MTNDLFTVTFIKPGSLASYSYTVAQITGKRQAKSVGGDQELHHSLSGFSSIPSQPTSHQLPATFRSAAVPAGKYGVLCQPFVTGVYVRECVCVRESVCVYVCV